MWTVLFVLLWPTTMGNTVPQSDQTPPDIGTYACVLRDIGRSENQDVTMVDLSMVTYQDPEKRGQHELALAIAYDHRYQTELDPKVLPLLRGQFMCVARARYHNVLYRHCHRASQEQAMQSTTFRGSMSMLEQQSHMEVSVDYLRVFQNPGEVMWIMRRFPILTALLVPLTQYWMKMVYDDTRLAINDALGKNMGGYMDAFL